MSRPSFVAVWAVFAFLFPTASAQAIGLLHLDVASPSPPITDTEQIQLFASTILSIFPDTGHSVVSSYTITGFDIDWEISSYDDRSGEQAPVVLPLAATLNLDPLASGTYDVEANWQNYAIFVIPGKPTSGTGSLSFTVVPEPSTLTLLTLGAVGLLAMRKCAG